MSIITIDGNIGAGKTTVLRILHSKYRWAVDLEPVHKWAPYLRDLYEHKSRAFEFQVRIWLDRCWIQPKSNSSTVMLMERSHHFQNAVFVKANNMNGNLTANQSETLTDMYSKAMAMWSPLVYIYLRSNPSNCALRIVQRARPGEHAIEPDYLENLHALHEDAYVSAIRCGKKVLVIDVESKSPDMIAAEIHAVLEKWFYVDA